MISVRTNPVAGAAEGAERTRTAARCFTDFSAQSFRGGRPGYVYFVQAFACDEGAVKIGFSGDPVERLRLIQLRIKAPLVIVALYEATMHEERRLHREFAEYRIRGEWFRPGPPIKRLIAELSSESAA